jgi:hypothetical protein
MLKYLAILGVVLGFAFVIARHDEYATLSNAHEAAGKSNPAVAGKPNEYHPQEHPENSYWDTPTGHIFHNALRWPEGTTVWAIILTLLAIAEQTSQTRKSAEATQESARAALIQANHMIASERAWVMVEAKFEHGLGLAWSAGETQASVIIGLLNAGPTPAWVYQQYVYLMVSPTVIASLSEYPTPNFPFTGEGSKDMIGHVSYEICPLTQGQPSATWKAWVRGKGLATQQNGLHVYIFGVVRYRDAFSSRRETYFGYSVKANNRLERIPNEAYNKHT